MHSTVCTDVEEASGDYQGFPTLSRFVMRGVWFKDVITFNNEDTNQVFGKPMICDVVRDYHTNKKKI